MAAYVQQRRPRRNAAISLNMSDKRSPKMDVALIKTPVFFVIKEVGAADLRHSGTPLRSAASCLRITGGGINSKM